MMYAAKPKCEILLEKRLVCGGQQDLQIMLQSAQAAKAVSNPLYN